MATDEATRAPPVDGKAFVRIAPQGRDNFVERHARPVSRIVRTDHDPSVFFSRFPEQLDGLFAATARVEAIKNRPLALRRVGRRQIQRITLSRVGLADDLFGDRAGRQVRASLGRRQNRYRQATADKQRRQGLSDGKPPSM